MRLKKAEEIRKREIEELENLRIEYYQFMKEEEHEKKEQE